MLGGLFLMSSVCKGKRLSQLKALLQLFYLWFFYFFFFVMVAGSGAASLAAKECRGNVN